MIRSKAATKAYREGWDNVWGKKPPKANDRWVYHCVNCDRPLFHDETHARCYSCGWSKPLYYSY